MEEPTFKCVTKLGHCISVIPFQNAIFYKNFSKIQLFYILFLHPWGSYIFYVNTHNCVFYILLIWTKEGLEMKAKIKYSRCRHSQNIVNLLLILHWPDFNKDKTLFPMSSWHMSDT